jgi:hypothetical protein
MADVKKETWTMHWRLFIACGVMILSPFQYGIDFGMIGGLQAMVGFLKVYHCLPTSQRELMLFRSTVTRRLLPQRVGTSPLKDSS